MKSGNKISVCICEVHKHREGRERCTKKAVVVKTAETTCEEEGEKDKNRTWRRRRRDEGAEKGEEMQTALLNSSFFLPFSHLCQVLLFDFTASLFVLPRSITAQTPFFFLRTVETLKCSLFFVHSLKFQRPAFVCVSVSLTGDYSSVSLGH